MTTREQTVYLFGRYRLDSGERRLTRDGKAIPLTPKAFDTLLVLVQHSGHALTKDELMRAVWPDGFVEEVNLAYNISILRKALADGQPGEKYIETVPKLGYRFIAPVRDVQRASPPSARRNTNLPAQVTRFIGRERELAEVSKAVTTKRLVTLTGAAGMGKTRLALEVGTGVLNHFPGGVWLAELAPLADGALVPSVVATALGVSEQLGRTTTDVLTAYIADKRMLILLDNCEHVVADCAQLADALLRVCPHLHILATSREALRLPGESIWRVSPLSMPNPTEPLTIERVNDFDAMALFIEHATLSQPEFAVNTNDLATIAAICQQLDGMPLAIEMAAAQMPFMGLAGVAAQLDDHLGLLTNGNRATAPHQQTLRATLNWSYDLLAEREQVLLARLSVFAGGWTVQAMQAVCQATHHDLLQLARHSLVVTLGSERDGPPRYRLLETIRDYAAEKLRERGEREATLDRHLDYFLVMAEEPMALAEFAGPRVDPWVRRVDADFDNLRAAFARAMVKDDEGETALRLADALTTYSFHRGRLAELGAWADQAWSCGDKAPTYARARGLLAKASACLLTGAKAQGIRLCEQALALLRQTEDRAHLAGCLEMLANNAFDERVQAYAEEALRLFQELGSRDGEGRIMRALGTVALRAGDRAHAAELLEQAIELAPWDGTVSFMHLHDADPKRALDLCAKKYSQLTPSDAPDQVAAMLVAYGIMLATEGDYAGARRMLEQSIRAWQQADAGRFFDLALLTVPLPLKISELSLRELRWDICGSFSFVLLGFIEHMLGRLNYALARLHQGRAFASEAGMIWLEVVADFFKISLKMADGHADLADLAMQEVIRCLRRFNELDQPVSAVCALVQVASLAARRGEFTRASALLGAVESLGPKLTGVMAYYIFCIAPLWLQHAHETIIAPTLAAARMALGDAAFEAAYAEGQRMTLDEAVAYALSDRSRE